MNAGGLQLDRAQIAIRVRGTADVLDLALRVLRFHGGRLLGLLIVGAAPFAVLNAWLLRGNDLQDFGDVAGYVTLMLLLVAVQAPLATAPLTLYLGQSLFLSRPSLSQVAGDFLRTLPQMFLLQFVMRALLFPLLLPLIAFYGAWPYRSEVILLERNPLIGRRGRMGTFRRISALHAGWSGELMRRACESAQTGGLLVVALTASLWIGAATLAGDVKNMAAAVIVCFPVGLWLVVGFFTVARFLSYLDLRIRREGWDVELLLRAEGERLARQRT